VSSDELLGWGSLIVSAAMAAFTGLTLMRTNPNISSEYQEVICPVCYQPFDALRFLAVNGVRRVTCPRCRYTWDNKEVSPYSIPTRLGQEHVW